MTRSRRPDCSCKSGFRIFLLEGKVEVAQVAHAAMNSNAMKEVAGCRRELRQLYN